AEPIDKITLQTRLREDLGLDGDDVEEFCTGLTDRFKVNLEGFDFYQYFRDEPNLMSSIFYLWRGIRYKKWHTVPITVDHLVRVVQIGKWLND
ncbi:MAG: DUF1493 family protein, partial [Pseudanabaena sp.]